MYSVRLGYKDALARIQTLASHGHHAEAMLAVQFTIEKTLRRTLKQLVVSAGFKSVVANKLMKNFRTLEGIKNAWEAFDPQHRKLPLIVGQQNWQVIMQTAQMRNDLVHGTRVYPTAECRSQTNSALTVLSAIKTNFDEIYGYSGWSKVRTRKSSKLHSDPKVDL